MAAKIITLLNFVMQSEGFFFWGGGTLYTI
jgi:hypothetical protein